MPTPVGPVPPDPDDPDLWDWGEGDDDFLPRPRASLLRMLVVGIVVIGLVLLLFISIL